MRLAKGLNSNLVLLQKTKGSNKRSQNKKIKADPRLVLKSNKFKKFCSKKHIIYSTQKSAV